MKCLSTLFVQGSFPLELQLQMRSRETGGNPIIRLRFSNLILLKNKFLQVSAQRNDVRCKKRDARAPKNREVENPDCLESLI